MRGAQLRQTLLTSDLANADTPNFEPQDVDFQSQLSAAMNAPSATSSTLGALSYSSSTQPQTTNTNGNGVDADETSADLAENGLLYDALTEVLSAHNATLEYAMEVK